MKPIRLIWPPKPYLAGFAVTDDTDSATTAQVRAVYDFLCEHRFLTTKTVWPFKPAEATGKPGMPGWTQWGVTLEDPDYRAYCVNLSRKGFELCLHGASAGNNRRERTAAAFHEAKALFGSSPVYICHSKNTENLYWGRRVTRLEPFRILARLAERHVYSGDIEGSPYYWGDICSEEVDFIRLLRTRRVNTLAANPSMPYRDDAKPSVRGWFSATRRRLPDCGTATELNRLKREFGCTILYQYLHRYAHPLTMDLEPAFVDAVRRISSDPAILVAPVGKILRRLRAMQGVFLVRDGDALFVVNSNSYPVPEVQAAVGPGCKDVVCIGSLDASSTVPLPDFRGYRPCGDRALRLNGDGLSSLRHDRFPLSASRSQTTEAVQRNRFDIDLPRDERTPHKRLSLREEYRLLAGQLLIVAGDRLRRLINRAKKDTLVVDGIPHWNHDGW